MAVSPCIPPLTAPIADTAPAQLAHRAGFPDGVINVVTTQKHVQDVAKELCENKLVKKISFTVKPSEKIGVVSNRAVQIAEETCSLMRSL